MTPPAAAAEAPVLTVQHLRKTYGQTAAVRDVSFTIEAGECFGILGPNGAGKSTTLKMCLAQTVQDAGSIRLLGYDMPRQALRAKKQIGVVPQQDNLDPDFNCIENLGVYAGYFGLQPARADIDALLEFAGLAGRAHDRVPELSGGMQRRLTLARALVNDPAFIFLDEPTTGLDPQARHLIWERMRRLQDSKKTLLLTTHFMEEAERLCNRIAIMDDGCIIAAGTPEDLIRKRVEREVVEVYGSDAGTWLEARRHCYQRREQFGQLVYCYADDAEPLVHELQQARCRFLHRPANLEDVFLRLTGRDLRE